MHPTLVRLSKASRKALSSKRGNKDYYKGSRVAYLPGGHRTGAPGKHTPHGGYVVDDEKVRVFIAPPLSLLNESNLKPYINANVKYPEERSVAGLPLTPRGVDGRLYAQVIAGQEVSSDSRPAREQTPSSIGQPGQT